MAVNTFGRSLGVRRTPSTAGTEREIRVFLAPDYTTQVALIPGTWISLTGGLCLSDVAGGSVTLDMDAPPFTSTLPGGLAASTLYTRSNLWAVYKNGKRQFEFLGESVQISDLPASGGVRTITISGKGSANLFSRAVVLPPGFPKQTAAFWTFKNTPVMSAWLSLFTAARARGGLSAVKTTFTPITDSSGQLWGDTASSIKSVVDFIPDLGTSLLTLLNQLTGQDLETVASIRCEWIMWPGLKLDVRPTLGVRRESKVIFNDAGSILERQHTLAIEELSNYIAVKDVYGATTLAQDSTSLLAQGHCEFLFSHDLVVNSTMRQNVAHLLLQKLKDVRSSWTIRVKPSTGREPFVDFNVGDWIGMDMFDPSTSTSSIQAFRVMAITIEDTGFDETVELVLDSLMDVRLKELQRKITFLVNNPPGGSTPTVPYPPSDDTGTYPGYTAPVGDLYGLVPNDHGGWDASLVERGCRVFFSTEEPTDAQQGDFWFDEDGTPPPVEDFPDLVEEDPDALLKFDTINMSWNAHPNPHTSENQYDYYSPGS